MSDNMGWPTLAMFKLDQSLQLRDQAGPLNRQLTQFKD
jgi:hypothetical protein